MIDVQRVDYIRIPVTGMEKAAHFYLCECSGMTPGRNASWLTWLHMTAPAAFVGYGLFLVSRSLILAVVVGAGVLLLCRFLIGLYAPRSNSDE